MILVIERSQDWSEGRKRFLNHHQEKYLQRLAQLREDLVKEKDIVRLSLPQASDKNTGFWEVIMTDLNDASASKNAKSTKSQKTYQSSAGGKLNSDLNRRGHLERLRRIRIMQMRRKLPPQLEPLHGIGITSRRRTENTPATEPKQALSMHPTAYHVNWMRGNHLVTPMVDPEKDIATWTLKQMRMLHSNTAYDASTTDVVFPNDFKTLLRKRNPSVEFNVKSEHVLQEPKGSNDHHTATSSHSRRSKAASAARVSVRSRPRNSSAVQPSIRSSPPLRVESIPNPNHESAITSQYMHEVLSHISSPSSRIEGSLGTVEDDTDDNSVPSVTGDGSLPKMVDRASSPVGFRLPPLEQNSRTSVSSSANSKKQIIVKIPDGTE